MSTDLIIKRESCPWCKSKSLDLLRYDMTYSFEYQVKCLKCKATGPRVWYKPERAFEAWNNRTDYVPDRSSFSVDRRNEEFKLLG